VSDKPGSKTPPPTVAGASAASGGEGKTSAAPASPPVADDSPGLPPLQRRSRAVTVDPYDPSAHGPNLTPQLQRRQTPALPTDAQAQAWTPEGAEGQTTTATSTSTTAAAQPIAHQAPNAPPTVPTTTAAAQPIAHPAPNVPPAPTRTEFIEEISTAYSDCGKSVVILTGNRTDLYITKGEKFLELERTLYQELAPNFTVLRFDCATGIGFFDDGDLKTLGKVVSEADALTLDKAEKMGDFATNVKNSSLDPLASLVLLNDTLKGASAVRISNKQAKPVCVIVRFAGSLFPAGDFDRLGPDDRKKLVTFLSMIESPWFQESSHLVVLVADTQTEINSRIVALPAVHAAEIDLPSQSERTRFISTYKGGPKTAGIDFENGLDGFALETAGLTLRSVSGLLETGRRTKRQIRRTDVLAEINKRLRADLGEMVTFSRPEHGPQDIIGHKRAGAIFLDIFRRCDNPDTAVPVILVSGPNGSGKTYQLEAYAAASGRVVIELKGLRGKYFGETDAAFEKLRLRLRNYNKVLILVDEAHTAMGSVHKGETHETEKRLAGNFIKLMGDPTMFGKVLWGLMTSRPDSLDPDVKSRAPIQVPIFDLEGDERAEFVTELFGRKKVAIPSVEVADVLEITKNYSARDFSFLVKEVKGQGTGSVLKTLEIWRASASILRERRLQKLIAAQHCSYPGLLPADLKEYVGTEAYETEIQMLKLALKM
jgi:hypothetical protein